MSDLSWISAVFNPNTTDLSDGEIELACEKEGERQANMLKSGRGVKLWPLNHDAAESINSEAEEIWFGHDGFYGEDGCSYPKDETNPKHPSKFHDFHNLRVVHVCEYYCPWSAGEWYKNIPSLKLVIAER